MKQDYSNKGQGAIEYLLIIGSAILVVAIVIIALVTLSATSTENVDNSSGEIKNPLKELVAEQQNQYYIPQNTTKYYKYTGENTTIGELESKGQNTSICVDSNCEQTTIIDNDAIISVEGITTNSTIPRPNLEEVPKPIPFKCGDILLDKRDNQEYTTVEIDGKCWMAENLNIGTLVNAPTNQPTNQTIQGTSCTEINKWCYSNNEANCDIYGGLYQWKQAVCENGPKDICPNEWHIPTIAELDKIMIKPQSTLKKTYNAPPWTGTNETGFSALPGGMFNYKAMGYSPFFQYINKTPDERATFWTSDIGSNNETKYYFIYTGGVQSRISQNNPDGFSIRCIKSD